MGVKKTIDDYAANIVQTTAELDRLIDCHPDIDKKKTQLSRYLSKWANLLDITVSVASNEQLPYTADELGFKTIPMSTKVECGDRQVSDYIFHLDDYDQFGGLCIERKGCTRKNGRMISSDLYSSFSNEENRSRFYREVERFHEDKRFDSMILVSECSYNEYLSFKPAFNGKQYNKCNYGMNVPARRATIGKLYAIGCPVFFAGTRQHAVEMYRDMIIQKCRQDYKKILNIED